MRWLRNLIHRRSLDRELDNEIRFHLHQRADEYIANGLSADEARRRTRLDFGGEMQIKEQVREGRAGAMLDALFADVRYAVRALRRSPGFAAAAIVALALGSGGTTALATILNDLVMRPPRLFRAAHELVVAGETSPRDPSYVGDVAPKVYDQWRSARSLERMAVIRDASFLVRVGDDVESAAGQAVSPHLLDMLGISPILGRDFAPDDDRPEATPVALISYSYWQSRFAGSRDVLERRLDIEGRSHAIIGILPRGYALGYGASILVPLSIDRQGGRESPEALVVGRRRAGANIGQVRAELSALQRVAEQAMADRGPGWGVRVEPMRGRTGLGGWGMALVFPVFFAAALLTLVATAANLAILMVARGMARVKEAAVRAALGATRYRLMQQVLLEALVLSAGGGALGLVVAVALSRVLISISPGAVPPEFEVPLDLQVFGFAALIVIVAGVASGTAPALAAARTNVVETLKGLVLPGRRTHRLRSALVVVEFAITMVFVVAVGLFLDAYSRILSLDPGFDRSNLLTVRIDDAVDAAENGPATSGRDVASRLRAVPGVRAVSVSSVIPPLRGGRDQSFAVEGGESRASGRLADVDAEFFGVLGLKIVRGLGFDPDDPTAGEQVVISQVLAGRYWPGVDPLGQFIQLEGEASVRQVVGIVGDVWRSFDVNRGVIPYLYRLRSDQRPGLAPGRRETAYALLRTSADAAALAPEVRRLLGEIVPDRVVPAPATLDQMIDRVANDLLFMAFLFTPMLLLTMVLSAAGIYGLIAQTVVTRTRELGVRAALGAERRQLVMLIIGDGLRLARAGLVFGIAGVVAINRIVMSMFVGVTWAEPWVVAVSTLVMVGVAMAASYRPAARAARVDPMTALRCE